MYVTFKYPPEPDIAMQALSKACMATPAIYWTVSDPLNFEEFVRFPYEVSEDLFDVALDRIRTNQEKIIKDVATAQDFALIDTDDNDD